jgi:hypothetical protein
VCRDGPTESVLIAALSVIPDVVEPTPTVREPTPMAVDWERTKSRHTVCAGWHGVPSVRLVSGPGAIPGTAQAADVTGDAGLHYVLGSFKVRANARQLVGLVADLAPSVMVVRTGGHTVYQVVVGPVVKDDIEKTVTAIVRAGFYDA